MKPWQDYDFLCSILKRDLIPSKLVLNLFPKLICEEPVSVNLVSSEKVKLFAFVKVKEVFYSAKEEPSKAVRFCNRRC